jgi:hypothetical protein
MYFIGLPRSTIELFMRESWWRLQSERWWRLGNDIDKSLYWLCREMQGMRGEMTGSCSILLRPTPRPRSFWPCKALRRTVQNTPPYAPWRAHSWSSPSPSQLVWTKEKYSSSVIEVGLTASLRSPFSPVEAVKSTNPYHIKLTSICN